MSYIVPIGPYHPALEEPIHAKLYTEGEVIRDADVFVGYNHRGIEKLATERNAIQTLVLVERVCGICSHSHAFTYAMCVESINGIEVPKRGQYIRVITAELERLHSHFLWLGIACHIIGHDSMFMHIWDERELVMDLLEKMTGNRVNYAMVTIGGARRDISAELRRELQETGYLRRSGKEKKGREKPIAPREFRSSSGLRILVGRSNVQNDALTRKADKRDLWLHTQKIHGSHVILCTEDGAYDDESLHEAALLAAYYSQAQGGSNVPVDYTSVKYVKKPAGARPGMVVYETYRTLYVTPDEETIRRLDRKNK